MSDNPKNYLKFHYPELADNDSLPYNYRFARHFTLDEVDENGIAQSRQVEVFSMKMESLDCTIYDSEIFHKPISKLFNEQK